MCVLRRQTIVCRDLRVKALDNDYLFHQDLIEDGSAIDRGGSNAGHWPRQSCARGIGAMAGMAASGGNPLAAAPGAIAGSLACRAWQGLASGGQRRLDAALIDRLGTQGPERDAMIQQLLAAQASQGQPQSLAARALLGVQGGSVQQRAR
jgi:hypothetical protein